MNGSTAKIINAAAKKYRVKSRRLKRAWYNLSWTERHQARQNLFGLCMQIKERQAARRKGQAERVKRERAKVKREKAASGKVQEQPATSNQQPISIIRKIIARLLKPFMGWQWAHRFERQLKPYSKLKS